ncbi:MAG: queuosine salvage family protein [Solirubrobacteraceae bacterium]
MQDLRRAAAIVAQRARHVQIVSDSVGPYAAALPAAAGGGSHAPEERPLNAARETLAAFWLTLNAINFGSGWFPTLRKRPGRSGYHTIVAGLRERFETAGPWTAAELTQVDAATLGPIFGQDPDHELISLYVTSLRDLGARVASEHDGRFTAVADAAGGSAVALALRLGGWACFADCSRYGELEVPFLKRAQIAAADLHRAGVVPFADLGRLTMFADNLVPHVLRLGGVLRFAPDLVARIEREALIVHDSPEEVEIRACAVHAVELLVAARGDAFTAAGVDQLLWQRGQQPRYKAVPRHRSRCTAY